MKEPKFKVGDIITQEHKGWRRKITSVIPIYGHYKDTAGYQYVFDFNKDEDNWSFLPSMCSEPTLITWSKQ